MNYESHEPRCKRRGCPRYVRGKNLGRDFCSGLCAASARFTDESHAIAEHLGHSDPVDEYLLAAVEFGKSIDRAQKARAALKRLSVDAGWAPDQFEALARGQMGLLPEQELAG